MVGFEVEQDLDQSNVLDLSLWSEKLLGPSWSVLKLILILIDQISDEIWTFNLTHKK